MSKPEQKKTEQTAWECPVCGVKAVIIAPGAHISMLQCMNCGWSMSVQQWNRLSKEEKKKLRKKKKRFKIF